MFTIIAPYVVGLLSVAESANCTSLARVVHHSHDSLSRILKHKRIEWKTLLSSLVLRTAGRLQGGYLVLDDTVIDKSFATTIENIAWIYSSKENRCVLGLNVVLLCWSNGTFTIPLALRFWKKDTGISKYDLALELLAYAKNILHLSPEYVVFDSWFASGDVMTACHSYGWHVYTQIKKNRLVDGMQIQKHHRHPYWIARGTLSCGIDVVVIKHGGNYFCTTNVSATRALIRAVYKTRWVIETLFRVLHSQLGFSACESRSLAAQTAHAHLCLVAVTILEAQRQDASVYALRRACMFDARIAENLVSQLLLDGA